MTTIERPRRKDAPRPFIQCAECGQTRRHACRNLCHGCSKRARSNGTIEDYPTAIVCGRALDLWIEDLHALDLITASNETIADRFGITTRTVERRKARARQLGFL